MIKGPRHFLQAKQYPKKIKKDDLITVRMQEWFNVLAADYAPFTPVNIAIRYYAVLGATGRVFEALLKSEDKMGQKIMPLAFLIAIRNTIYHAENPFKQLDPENGEFITFFSHLYEHCRREISSITATSDLPYLLAPLDIAERQKPYFTQALYYAMSEAKVHRKKVKSEVQAKLKETYDTIIELIEHFQFQPGFLAHADTPDAYQRSNIIRSSAIGALLAWFSADSSCLLKGDFYDKIEDKQKSAISKGYKQALLKEHAEFISAGKLYRYEQVSLDVITRRFAIAAESPFGLQLHIDHAIEVVKVELVKNLVTCWLSHPFVMNLESEQDPIKGKWLIAAAKVGCLPLVQYFFNGCSHNSWRAFSLVHAAKQGHEDVVKWIIAHLVCSEDLLKHAITMASKHKNIVKLLQFELNEKTELESEILKGLVDLLLLDSDDEANYDPLDSPRSAIYSDIRSGNDNNVAVSAVQKPLKHVVARSLY